MTTTSVSNKYDMIQDIDSGRRRRIKAVHSAPDVVHKDPTPKVAYDSGCARSCVRTTTSLDDMTLGELDRVIKAEEAKVVAVMQAEADGERSRATTTPVVAAVCNRTLPSQGEVIYPPTLPSQGGATYPPTTTTTTTTTGELKVVQVKMVAKDGQVATSMAASASPTAGADRPIIPSSGVPTSKTASRLAAGSEEWPSLCGECNVESAN